MKPGDGSGDTGCRAQQSGNSPREGDLSFIARNPADHHVSRFHGTASSNTPAGT
jgi:hypothetical protein